jgi:Heavy metal binding domain
MIETIMDKTINYAIVFVLINISMTAKNIDSGNSPNFLDHKTEISADTIYSCTMHPDIKSLRPGKCPECKMDLIPFEYAKIDSSKSVSEDYYTCSMHPEVQSEKPGSCPKCGMELIKKSEVSNSNDGMMGMMMNSHWMIVMGIIMVVMMTIHFVM